MTYKITVERVLGFSETREVFQVQCSCDTQAQDKARTIVGTCGTLAAVVGVELID